MQHLFLKILINLGIFAVYYIFVTWDFFLFIPEIVRLVLSSVIPVFLFILLNKIKNKLSFSLDDEVKIAKSILNSLLIISTAFILYTLEISNQPIDTLNPYELFRHLKILPLYVAPLRIYIEFYQLNKD